MNTTQLTAEPTEQLPDSSDSSRSARSPRTIAARMTALLLALAAAVLLGVSPASAAATPNPYMSAQCQYGSISVEGPDLRINAVGYPDWTAQYRVRLYTWTSRGWSGPVYGPWYYSNSSSWVSPDSTSFRAPHGSYVQAVVDSYYSYRGTYVGLRSVFPHHLPGTNAAADPGGTWCQV